MASGPSHEESGGQPAREAGTGSELEILTLRLGLAEERSRRLGRAAWGLGAVAVVSFVAATLALLAPYSGPVRLQLDRLLRRGEAPAARGTTLEAQQLVFRGRDGEVRGEIALRENGALALGFYDRHGRARAALVVEADGPATLTLAGDGTQPGLQLTSRNLRFTDTEGGAFLTSTSLGLTSWDVQDARSGVWLGARPDGTSALTLSDRGGTTRAGVTLKPDGSPTLTLYDPAGRTGAVLDVPPDGARLGLFADGVARAGVGHGPGGSQVSLYGADGKDRVTLRNPTDDSIGLFVHDRSGRERVAMGVQPAGASGLSLFDAKGTHRAALSLAAEDAPQLTLFDPAGGRRAALALAADGTPALRLEEQGQTRAVLGTRGERDRAAAPASLVLYDKDGAIVFQAPIL